MTHESGTDWRLTSKKSTIKALFIMPFIYRGSLLTKLVIKMKNSCLHVNVTRLDKPIINKSNFIELLDVNDSNKWMNVM